MDRREFLQIGTQWTTLLWAAGVSKWAEGLEDTPRYRGLLTFIAGEKVPGNYLEAKIVTPPGHLSLVTGSGHIANSFAIPFLGHEVIQHPKAPHLIVLLEKWGTRACLFDCAKGSVTKLIDLSSGRRFFGHGLLSDDGNYLYSGDMNDAGDKGVISIWKFPELTLIKEIPSGGLFPHDMAWSNDRSRLFIANNGAYKSSFERKVSPDYGAPTICEISLAQSKIVAKYSAPISESHWVTHLKVGKQGYGVFGGNYQTAQGQMPLVGSFRIGGKAQALDLKNKIDPLNADANPAFSVCMDETTGLAATTVSRSNCTVVWNYKTNQLLKVLKHPNPSGVVFNRDQNSFLVSGYSTIDNFGYLDGIRISDLSMTRIAKSKFLRVNTHMTYL